MSVRFKQRARKKCPPLLRVEAKAPSTAPLANGWQHAVESCSSTLGGAVWASAWLWLSLLCMLIGAIGCQPSSSGTTGGETHFLRLCDPSGDACGSGLACVCGVCTLSCAADSGCAHFPGSACRNASAGSCGQELSSNVCDATCQEDGDCAAFSDQHRCHSGVCRLDAGDLGGGGGSGPNVCVAGEIAANEVLIIGDSFFATTHQVTAYLENLARSAGVLPAGQRYRDQSRLTGNALALLDEGIRDQYEMAMADAPAKVVIMNGGGADVLLGSCDVVDPQCPLMVAASDALRSLFQQMATDGITDVVFVAYPDPQPVAVREKMDILRPLFEEACEQSPVSCKLVDLRPVFEGNYDEYIQPTGLNPTDLGSEATASAIWATMQQACIAQ